MIKDKFNPRDSYKPKPPKPSTPLHIRFEQGKEVYKRVDKIRNLVDIKEAQEGLVPIFNSPFYMTPTEPADPWDCNRYPDSPYCGRNPFNLKLIDLKPNIVYDECNIGVQITPTLGFIKLPVSQIVYRNPDCQLPPPPEPPKPTTEEYGEKSRVPPSCDNGGYVLRFTTYDFEYIDGNADTSNPPNFAYSRIETKRKLLEYNYDLEKGLGKIDDRDVYFYVKWEMEYTAKINSVRFYTHYVASPLDVDKVIAHFRDKKWSIPNGWKTNPNAMFTRELKGTFELFFDDKQRVILYKYTNQVLAEIATTSISQPTIVPFSALEIIKLKNRINTGNKVEKFPINANRFSYTLKNIGNVNIDSDYDPRQLNVTVTQGGGGYNYNYSGSYGLKITAWDTQFECAPYRYSPPPPPPKPPKNCDCDMTCCPDYSDLLKALIKKVDTLSNIVGVDEYPAELPASLLQREGKELGEVKIPNLTQLFGWYIERFDELIGQFEIDIEIEDTDLTQEGNQSKTLRLPNLAETLAEMTSLMIQSSVNTELLVNICNRTLIESGQDKQQNFKSHAALNAIIEYLGFNVAEITEGMPLTFTPGAEDFAGMLKESEVPVKIVDYNQRSGLATQLQDLLHAAAITRAVHWKRLDPNKDMQKQIFDDIVNSKKNRDAYNEMSDKELEEFNEEVNVKEEEKKEEGGDNGGTSS